MDKTKNAIKTAKDEMLSEMDIAQKKMQEDIKETINSKIQEELENSKKNLDDNQLPSMVKKAEERFNQHFNSLIILQQFQYRLRNVLTDLEKPSMRHAVTPAAKYEIERYLTEMEGIDENLSKMNIEPKDVLTSFDWEQKGDVYHYICADPEQNIEGIKKYKEMAIFCYKQAILSASKRSIKEGGFIEQSIEDIVKLKANAYTCRIKIKLGNAYSANLDYWRAIEQYELVVDNFKYDADAWHSFGDALQGAKLFEKAVEVYGKAIELRNNENEKQSGSLLWESLYQQGNAYISLEKYDEAIKCYEEINMPRYFTWYFHGFGDAYRKSGKIENIEKSIPIYKRELGLLPNVDHDNRLNETAYKIGRSYLDIGKCEKAIEIFYETDKKYKFSNRAKPLWDAFFGYALSLSKDEKERVAGATRLNNAVQNALKQKTDEPKPQNIYDLAVCYALNHQRNEAIFELTSLFNDQKYTKSWAKAANYSDFVTIKDEVKALVEPS